MTGNYFSGIQLLRSRTLPIPLTQVQQARADTLTDEHLVHLGAGATKPRPRHHQEVQSPPVPHCQEHSS